MGTGKVFHLLLVSIALYDALYFSILNVKAEILTEI